MNRQTMNHLPSRLVICFALALLCTTSWNTIAAPKNVILIIGDGFDDQHVTMGRNYLTGMSGTLILDGLPFRGAVQVETLSASGEPEYVADSANTATAIATGRITSVGRVGTDIADEDLPTIAERAIGAGLRVGLVTTSSITDATPAAFLAHVSSRSCEGPEEILGSTYYGLPQPVCPQDAKQNNGPGSIIEQLFSSKAHILFGGGQKFLNQIMASGESIRSLAEKNGFRVITDRDELSEIQTDQAIIGLFDTENLEVKWRGSDGRRAAPTETSWLHSLSDFLGEATPPEIMECEPNPAFAATPELASMTATALRHLSASNESGFFLMVESASIDKQSHKRNPCGSLGEIAQLEEVLAVSLEFAGQHNDTLVMVTADHAQAAQILPEPSHYSDYPVPIYSPGHTARVRTREGSVMRINYATNNGFSEEHTGANVPLFANLSDPKLLKPFMKQRDLYHAMMTFLGLNSGDNELKD
jgi:alkaline phosphatase